MEREPKKKMIERGGEGKERSLSFLPQHLPALLLAPFFARSLTHRQTTNYSLNSFFVLLGFKCLTDVFRDNPNIQERVENLLEHIHTGTGGWKELAHKYQMEEDDRNSLARRQEGGKGVIGYLKSTYPELTAYDFCKDLKDLRRNDIIKILSDHLVSVAN